MTEKTGVEFKLFMLIAVIFVSVFYWLFNFLISDDIAPFNPHPVVLENPKIKIHKRHRFFSFGLTVNEITYGGDCHYFDDENGNSYCEKKELWEDVIRVEGYIPYNPSWDFKRRIVRDLVIQKIHYQDRLGQKHTLIISEQAQQLQKWSFRWEKYTIWVFFLINIFVILYLWYQYRKQKMIFNSLFKQGNR